jgi:hypothetical protein
LNRQVSRRPQPAVKKREASFSGFHSQLAVSEKACRIFFDRLKIFGLEVGKGQLLVSCLSVAYLANLKE